MIERMLRMFPRVQELEALLDNAIAERERVRDALRVSNHELIAANSELDRVAKSLQETVAAKSMLEDRLSAALEDRSRLWGLVETSIAGERTAYQSGLNLQWQKEGFGAPYPDAPQMPPHRVHQPVPDSIVPRPMTGSERMAAGTRDFIRQYTQARASK